MGFLDSSSSVVDATLTRLGRQLLAKNDGSFQITKFAFGDDEINYQLYNLATNDDSNILNLPLLEPSSNENTALRYRLVTLGKGAISVATLIVSPQLVVLVNPNAGGMPLVPHSSVVTVQTVNGIDNSYTVSSRDSRIATASVSKVTLANDAGNGTSALILISASLQLTGTTIIDIVGNDTGAAGTVVVNTQNNE